MTLLTSPPDVILFVTDSDVTLWVPSRRTAILQLSSADEKLSNQLVDVLQKLGASRAQIVLDITDIHLQVEQLPRASIFDQAKVAERRSHFLYPTAELRMALRLDDTPSSTMLNYLFVAVPNNAQLAAIYNSLARSHVWLQNVLLFPVEFWGLHWNVPKADEKQRDLVLLNLETHSRLLAIESDSLLLSRTLAPAVADRPELLKQEIQTTQSYLLRKGWNKDNPWSLSVFGLPLDRAFAAEIGSKWRFYEPQSDARAMLVEKLFTGKAPTCALVSSRMRQRQWLLRTNRMAQRLVHIAAVAVLLLVSYNTVQLFQAERALSGLQAQLANMPAFDQAAQQQWQRLNYWRTLAAQPLPVLSAVAKTLPPAAFLRGLSWNSPPPEQGSDSYNLNMTVSGLRNDEVASTIALMREATAASIQQERTESRQQSGELGSLTNSSAPQTDYYFKLEPMAAGSGVRP